MTTTRISMSKALNESGPVWTNTMDSEGHLTLWCGRKRVWEGSYEAFIADGDVQPPANVVDAIHAKAEKLGLS